MFFWKKTSSKTFRLIPAQDEKKIMPSKTFRLIPSEDDKTNLIKQLQRILPENGWFIANFNREKENFWVDIVESKDEFIAHIASVSMLDTSAKALLDFIQENEENYTSSDFLKLLKEQIDVHMGTYNLISSIKWLHNPKSMDETIWAMALKKYLINRVIGLINSQELEQLRKFIDVYNRFIECYEELLESGAYIDREIREDVSDIFQNFSDAPDNIETLTLMKIEKVGAASKQIIPKLR